MPDGVARAARHHVMPPAAGLPELRHTLAVKLQRENGISADPESQILVTNGAKQASCMPCSPRSSSPGDEVIFPTPAYVFGGTIALVGGKPFRLALRAGRVPLIRKRLERAITPRTKVLLLEHARQPHRVRRRARRSAGGRGFGPKSRPDRRRGRGLRAASLRRAFAHQPRLLPEAADRTVTVFSLTKAHNLMGFRVGRVAAAFITRDHLAGVDGAGQ
ncbi:MAG: aminotransferase class I/II-fold pyridoxal phosphate-dependent enzyme [Desulfobacterales bacterium]|nr:aminotransferase class I/II-fold pyridoxal phosphate-dependent enzyme [Desulfobacterales bacterium]